MIPPDSEHGTVTLCATFFEMWSNGHCVPLFGTARVNTFDKLVAVILYIILLTGFIIIGVL